MTRRRWIADEVSGNTAAITGSNASHLARVLRARPGQEFDVAADGAVRRGVITSVSDERVSFSLHEHRHAEEALRIHLLLAIFKFDRMEWAIEKATELGVSSILPAIARRTDTHLAAASAKRVERWRKIAKEASQQSRRVSEPEIVDPMKFKAAIEHFAYRPLRIVCSETADPELPLASLLETEVDAVIAVGPEGGWADEELALFMNAGWKQASLGTTILRAETAAIAALAISGAFPQK